MLRRIFICVFGTLAFATFGGLIGQNLSYDGGVFGVLGGAFSFACLRLWLGDRRGMGSGASLTKNNSKIDVPNDSVD